MVIFRYLKLYNLNKKNRRQIKDFNGLMFPAFTPIMYTKIYIILISVNSLHSLITIADTLLVCSYAIYTLKTCQLPVRIYTYQTFVYKK